MQTRSIAAFIFAVTCFILASAHADRAITVAADGTGDFATVQAAVDSVADNSPERTIINIKPGTYKERLRIDKPKQKVTFRGGDADATKTVLTYDLYASVIVPPATQPVGTSGSASTTIFADDFSAENITFENTAGQVGQALALKISGDRGVFRNCRFLGWQDTLCADGGRQLFEKCYIEGRVDFIFGRSIAVFDRCEIRSKNGGYVTAARTKPEDKFGYVFLDCTLVGDETPTYLGRPWQWDRGSNAAVAFIRCKMGPHIRAEGWNPWDLKDKKNEQPEAVTRYREFGSMDLKGAPLDVSKRVAWSKQLSEQEAAEFIVENVLGGKDNWKP